MFLSNIKGNHSAAATLAALVKCSDITACKCIHSSTHMYIHCKYFQGQTSASYVQVDHSNDYITF